MQEIIQRIVDVLILVMASALALCTLALLAVHLLKNARGRSMQRIRQQILCLLNPDEQIEYLRGRVRELLRSGEPVSLRSVRGIRTRRGLQVLELVSREVTEREQERLRNAVLDEWYAPYLTRAISKGTCDMALIAEKLLAQLHAEGFTEQICRNFRRWPVDPDVQEIGLLVFFMRGDENTLVQLFTDPNFALKLSFRTLQELFHCYFGDTGKLCEKLLCSARDPYVRRACVRALGQLGDAGCCPLLLPGLHSENLNFLLETVRSLGQLRCQEAVEEIRAMTAREPWELRCAAVDALYNILGDSAYPEALHCLCDRAWWVRFHAAQALVRMSCRSTMVADVAATGDRYAADMVRYMIERELIRKGGAA